MPALLTIDGSQGEGGGQVLRTCLSLSALTGRPFQITHIRANRSKPGLRPQHLSAVRAVAAICGAELQEAEINSTTLAFRPAHPPRGGEYLIDVNDAAPHGSAGSITLIFQALLWPLLFAAEPAQLTLRGGTFVPFSPPYHYVAGVARPAFARFGADFDLRLDTWGWMPAGGGQISATIRPVQSLRAAAFEPHPAQQVSGVAAVTNLPAHIPDRMARRAENGLRELGLQPAVRAVRETGPGPGAGLVLWLPQAGFSSLGRPGLPAQEVADRAVADLRTFIDNRAAVDLHLADQLLLPMALAKGRSHFTTGILTRHTLTNAALLQRWLDTDIHIAGDEDGPGRVTVQGSAFTH